jgi:hypothetical protein
MNRWPIFSITIALTLMMLSDASEAQNTSDANDRITAGFIAQQLRAMGLPANIDKDPSGDPRVGTKVDGYDWSIYFYDCTAGSDLGNRGCISYQFYSGYVVPAIFPLATINKWNTEKRYAKAYLQVQHDKTTNARLEIDVLVSGTGADPSRTFQAYFKKMKDTTDAFRKAIGFK